MNSAQKAKAKYRDHFLKVRKKISPERREEAKKTLLSYLEEFIKPARRVLSFMSLPGEVDLTYVNSYLLREEKLFLNCLEEEGLNSYHVTHLEKETQIGKFQIVEPNPNLCRRETFFDCILVPAIAFDEKGNRIGYGFGYYDNLFNRIPECLTIGVGFREQLSTHELPVETHDKPVKQLCLV